MLALLAISSQAATINWGNSATSLIRDNAGTLLTGAAATTAGFQIQLMYLSAGMASYPGVASVGAAVTPATMSTKTAGTLTSASDTYTFNTDYTTGSEFFIRATATFGGQQYTMDVFELNSYGNTFALAAIGNAGSDAFVWAPGTYGGTGTEGAAGKWVPVPEPATAALAIAGLAMLIRRRK